MKPPIKEVHLSPGQKPPAGLGVFKPVFQEEQPKITGLGDMVEKIAKPIAKALKLDCLDKDGQLKAESPCARRKAILNRVVPF